jgi:hypothetical protein
MPSNYTNQVEAQGVLGNNDTASLDPGLVFLAPLHKPGLLTGGHIGAWQIGAGKKAARGILGSMLCNEGEQNIRKKGRLQLFVNG